MEQYKNEISIELDRTDAGEFAKLCIEKQLTTLGDLAAYFGPNLRLAVVEVAVDPETQKQPLKTVQIRFVQTP